MLNDQEPADATLDPLREALRVLYEPYGSGRPAGSRHAKTEALRCLPPGPDAFAALVWACRHPVDLVRTGAAWALAETGDRRAYSHLAHMLRDPCRWPGRAAVRSLGRLGETRATFAIINLYPHSQRHFRQEALDALAELRDPRAAEFLRRVVASDTSHIGERAARALGEVRASKLPSYRYTGRPEAIAPPGMLSRALPLRSAADLERVEQWMHRQGCAEGCAYVVAVGGTLVLWPSRWDEAQAVRGGDVLAAGTIRLVGGESWAAEELTNCSFDYYPDVSSFPLVRSALERAGVQCPQEGFTQRFPEDWPQYRCGYCDDPFLANQPFYGQAAGDALDREMEVADPGAWAG